MKDQFRDWYRAVQLSLDSQVEDARWAGVQALAKSINNAGLEGLAHAAFRFNKTTSVTSSLRTRLAGSGDALGDEEFALLAGATLAVILDLDTPMAARAATMIVTAHFHGLREVRQPMDLTGMGAKTRLALGRTTRRRPSLQLEDMPSLELNSTQDEENDDPNDDPNQRIDLLAKDVTGLLRLIADRQKEFEQRAVQFIRIQDEELEMLWWLQGGRTKSGQFFKSISRQERPFLLGRELAEVTFALPGSAIQSILFRAGIEDGEPIEIAAALQALQTEWLRTALPDEDLHKVSAVTSPLHEGIKRRLEVDGEDTWIASWASVCGIDKTSCLTEMQLADLFYCEQLLIHK
jgi:hypothetical protein